MTEVFVAAGSNVDAVANLRRALDVLARRYPGLRCSRAYRNAAVGFEGEDFVNLVVAFETGDDIRTVLAQLHAAEAACGRERDAPKWAPRSMDLDVLLYGSMVTDEPGLVLPRPDLVRRAYMLGPAAELAPDLVHPTSGSTLRELWESFDRDAHAMTARGPRLATRERDGLMSADAAGCLDSEAAPAIHGDHLSGDVRRLGREKERGARDVFGGARSLERSLRDDFRLQRLVEIPLGPQHGPGRDAIHPHVRAELARERLREHDEPRLCRRVHRVSPERAPGVNVHHVDDEAARRAQRRRCGLREEQRRAQVRADEVVELRGSDGADGRRIESRSVVDEHVDAAVTRDGLRHESGQAVDVVQVATHRERGAGAYRVQFGGKSVRSLARAVVVHDDVGARRVQGARHRGAEPLGSTRDEDAVPGQRFGLLHAPTIPEAAVGVAPGSTCP